MKNPILGKIVGIILMLFSTINIFGRGVFNGKVAPDEVFVGSNQPVKITAEISGVGLYLSSAVLYQTTAQGQTITNLGPLYDDGTHSDILSGDTIFTAQIQLNPQQAGETYFRVSAAFQGDRNRYLSQVITNTAMNPLPQGAISNAAIALNLVVSNYSIYLTSNTVDQARQLALNDASNNPAVTSANLSDGVLCVVYQGGLHLMEPLSDPNGLPVLSDPIYPSVNGIEIFASWYTGADVNSEKESEITEAPNNAAEIFGNANSMQFQPNPPLIDRDGAASLSVINAWGNNAAVVLCTHGNYYPEKNPSTGVTDYEVVFLSGENIGNGLISTERAADLAASPPRLGIMPYTDFGNPSLIHLRYFVYPGYITRYCAPMRNTLFYMSLCEGLQDDSLWNALAGKGAKVAFGWKNSVYRDFDAAMLRSLMSLMLPSDQTPPMTALQAFNSIQNKCDGHNPLPACLQMRVASSAWNNFTFANWGGLVNGNFETGDWTGWTHGGDYDSYAQITSSQTSEGSYAASLGKWTVSANGYNQGQSGGNEYFYQDIPVSGDNTLLSFDWWQEGYNNANLDWFDAYITDTQGAVLQTLISHGGKPGSSYGSYYNTSGVAPVSSTGYPGNGFSGGWYHINFDVTAYKGSTIRIYFDQHLSGNGYQTRTYIDNVQLSKPIFQE
jgi:hypothetical protein